MILINLTKELHTAEGSITAHFELTIHKGEFLTLFGPSGAGKTTLMRMIAGLEKPDKGRIEVEGEVWFDATQKINLPPQKRSIGFVFQDYALFPTMSVKENLLFAAQTTSQKHAVEELLEMLELTALAHRKPHTLSGGQQQRVALGRALVSHPKLLLLDEPLSALDPSMRHKLQDELKIVHRRLGLTTLLVSHDVAETVKLSDRLASVQAGKIVYLGDPMEFFTPQTLSGKLQLIGEILKIEEDFPTIIVTLLVGSSLVKTVISRQEAIPLHIGDHAIIATKAFTPTLLPLKK